MQVPKPVSGEEKCESDGTVSKLIVHASRALTRVADARMRDLGLTVGQLPVFLALKGGARRTQKELAQLAGVEQPTMAQLLSRMERDGLLRWEPDPADGRRSLISLTERALERMPPARAILAQGNQEALAGFDDKEIEVFLSMLRRVIANVAECRS